MIEKSVREQARDAWARAAEVSKARQADPDGDLEEDAHDVDDSENVMSFDREGADDDADDESPWAGEDVEEDEAPGRCACLGCEEPAAPRLPACAVHWAAVPTAAQIAYHEEMEGVLVASNVQRARHDAWLRVGVVLRGVKA